MTSIAGEAFQSSRTHLEQYYVKISRRLILPLFQTEIFDEFRYLELVRKELIDFFADAGQRVEVHIIHGLNCGGRTQPQFSARNPEKPYNRR